MFEPEESLSPDEMLMRFTKVFGRDMTTEERRAFFLLPGDGSSHTPEKT
jgi:hypothetical protein